MENVFKTLAASDGAIQALAVATGKEKQELKGLLEQAAYLNERYGEEIVMRKKLANDIMSGRPLAVIKAEIEKEVLKADGSAIVRKLDEYIEAVSKIEQAFAGTVASTGLKLGTMHELDNDMGGFKTRAKLYLLGGRAQSGKTTVMRNLAVNLVESNPGQVFVNYISLDDSAAEILAHVISQMAGVEPDDVTHSNAAKPDDRRKIAAAWERFRALKEDFCVIDGNTVSTLGDIVAISEHFRKLHPSKELITIVDSFHDIRHPGEIRERYMECATELKDMSVRLDSTVLAVVQLIKMGKDVIRPRREDMAETVRLDYEANMIMLAHNEVDAHKHEPEFAEMIQNPRTDAEAVMRPIIELDVQKNKITHKCKGTYYFKFDLHSSKMIEIPRNQIESYRCRAKQTAPVKAAAPSSLAKRPTRMQ